MAGGHKLLSADNNAPGPATQDRSASRLSAPDRPYSASCKPARLDCRSALLSAVSFRRRMLWINFLTGRIEA